MRIGFCMSSAAVLMLVGCRRTRWRILNKLMGNVHSSHRASAFSRALNYAIDLLPIYYYYLNCKLINGIVYRAAYRLYRIHQPSVCCERIIIATVNTIIRLCLCSSLFSLISLIVSRGKHSKLHVLRANATDAKRLKANLDGERSCNANEISTECLLSVNMHSHKCNNSPEQQHQMNIRFVEQETSIKCRYRVSAGATASSSSTSHSRHYYYYLSCSVAGEMLLI